MMNCKNCKYFELQENPYGYGWCSNIKIVDDLATTEKKDTSMPKDGIYSTCDEQRGELMIGPNFGCIHFKDKTNV